MKITSNAIYRNVMNATLTRIANICRENKCSITSVSVHCTKYLTICAHSLISEFEVEKHTSS